MVNIDWCRRRYYFFSLLSGSGRENTSHIPFLIIRSWNLSFKDLMGVAGFNSLGITLNLAEPEYLEHVSSVFIFSLWVCERNWTLSIGPLQLLKSSLYWYYGIIQSFSSLDQVNQFILASESIPDQGTKELSSSLYNTKQGWIYIVSIPFHLIWPFNNCHVRYSSLWSLVAYYCSLWSQIFYPYILLILLLREQTAKRSTPYWRQTLLQILTKLPLILEFIFHWVW